MDTSFYMIETRDHEAYTLRTTMTENIAKYIQDDPWRDPDRAPRTEHQLFALFTSEATAKAYAESIREVARLSVTKIGIVRALDELLTLKKKTDAVLFAFDPNPLENGRPGGAVWSQGDMILQLIHMAYERGLRDWKEGQRQE